MVSQSQIKSPADRVRVEMDNGSGARQVKIRVESFDQRLGWYSSSSVTLGLDHLPLLEQAIAEMRACERARNTQVCEIIPFPTAGSLDATATS